MKKIVLLIAGDNFNVKLAQAFQDQLESKGAEVNSINLIDLNLPLYTPRSEASLDDVSKNVISTLTSLESADAFMVITPEYNGGIPPVLTNFIAWASRSSEDWRKYFNGKTAAIASHSGGGGASVLMALRTQLAYLGADVIGRQVVSTFAKAYNPEDVEAVSGLVLR